MAAKTFSTGRIALSLLLLAIIPATLFSQIGYQFGQNKVQYKDFDWAVFRTDHFDVYYYTEEATAAKDAARMAERAYDYLSTVLDHKIKQRIPLILYASLNDFQQTNVVGGLMGQGTRGVTEGLKHRVALPITGSYREFHHVLSHELVHAFQFDLMFRSDLENNRFSPPLWFMEGMAEYLSNGMDNITRMWVREGLRHDDLLSVSQLNRTYDIRVYRLGQSLWHFIGESYGVEKVGEIFKTAIVTGRVEEGVKKHLNIDLEQLTEKWHTYAKSISVPEDSTLLTSPEYATQLTGRNSYYHRTNLVPSISPDGKHIAYVANKNLNDDIFLMTLNENGEHTDRMLLEGGASKQFETLRFFDTAIGWSADGNKLAFVSKSGKDDAIYVMDAHSQKILYTFRFDQLNGLLSPTFSPDASSLVFAGISGGISDLYQLNLSDGNLTRLTNTPHATLHPTLSPDGSEVAYMSDRGPGADLERLLFGEYELVIYSMESGESRVVQTLPGNTSNPQWLNDGSEIAFLSDTDGIANIYKIRLASGEITQLTRLTDGITGITATTPAFSISPDGSRLVFSSFQKDGWHLFLADENILQPIEPSEPANTLESDSPGAPGSILATSLPEIADPNTLYTSYTLAHSDSVQALDYSHKFKLDGISLGGGYSSYFGGSAGAQFLFSDMLGDHNLYFSTQLQFSDPRHSDLGLTYLNMGNRLNYGLQVFQDSYLYTAYYTFSSIGFIRNTYRGFNGITSYPLSRFMRLEFTAGLTWVDQDIVEDVYSFSGYDRNSENLATFNYGQVGTALVYDNSVYGMLGPMLGSRSRVSVETTTNDFQFTNLIADYRAYTNFNHRSVLAFRMMGGASFGRDQQVFGLGGPFTFRGADYGEILGPNFLLGNLEYRFPLLWFLPTGFDRLSGAAFVDAAAAWGLDAPGLIEESFQPFTNDGGFRLNDLNAALGIGARFNLGYFLLQYDLAWQTDLQGVSSPVNRFSIGTFF